MEGDVERNERRRREGQWSVHGGGGKLRRAQSREQLLSNTCREAQARRDGSRESAKRERGDETKGTELGDSISGPSFVARVEVQGGGQDRSKRERHRVRGRKRRRRRT